MDVSRATLALIATLINGVLRRGRVAGASDRSGASDGRAATRTRTVVTAIGAGLLAGLLAFVIARVRGHQTLRDVTMVLVFFDSSFHLLLAAAVTMAVILAVGGGAIAGGVASLVGLLTGATGADIERRVVPNQGIHQSARNIVVFAALGTLIVGVPYGAINLLAGAVTMETLPTAADWWRLALVPGFSFGVLAGLLPGAAVIQHYVLRLVLWASGAVPLRYAQFLNFATERRLLQRVGGRYRFIHVLLRDHLSADSPSVPVVGARSGGPP